jgi:hypothetical protein
MTPSEHDLYVLLWRKVYRWLLERGPGAEIGWWNGDLDDCPICEAWPPPDQAGGQPIQLRCEISEPERQREQRVWNQVHGGATYLQVINGEPLASSLLRWTQWGFILTKAEIEGVLQPDEVGFVRVVRRELLYQAAMVEIIAHERAVADLLGSAWARPCTCPLWHCAKHPNTGNG